MFFVFTFTRANSKTRVSALPPHALISPLCSRITIKVLKTIYTDTTKWIMRNKEVSGNLAESGPVFNFDHWFSRTFLRTRFRTEPEIRSINLTCFRPFCAFFPCTYVHEPGTPRPAARRCRPYVRAQLTNRPSDLDVDRFCSSLMYSTTRSRKERCTRRRRGPGNLLVGRFRNRIARDFPFLYLYIHLPVCNGSVRS